MGSEDEAARLRDRLQESYRAYTRRPGAVRPSRVRVAEVTGVGGGGGPNRYFTVTAKDVSGAETEGGAGTLTAAGYTFKALNLGTTAPALAVHVICTYVEDRWVFRYD